MDFIERQEKYIEQLEKESTFCRVMHETVEMTPLMFIKIEITGRARVAIK